MLFILIKKNIVNFFCIFLDNNMVKSLQRLSIESFFKCRETKLVDLFYCLFKYIYVVFNRREIYFLCENDEQEVCLSYLRNHQCKHCKRLNKFNSLYQKIENEKRTKTFKLVYFVDKIIEHILKYKKYYILPELKDKYCNICNYRSKIKND